MALAVNHEPSNYASVNNELLFTVYESVKAEDDVTYPDYTYVCDVYVSGTLVGRLKARPDPLYQRGIFDVGPILRSYVSYGLKATYSNATETYDNRISYVLKFGEEYSSTLYTNLLIHPEKHAYKTYSIPPFQLGNAITGLVGEENSDVIDDVDNDFATNRPDTSYEFKSSKWTILPFIDDTSGITDFSYKFYNSAGTQVGATGTISAAGYIGTKILQLNAGFVKLAATSSLTQAQQDSVDYLEVYGNGETITIRYLCSKFTPVIIAWLNQYGGYDSQTFGFVNMKTNEITRKDFRQLNYQMSSSGVISYASDGVYYGGRRGYATNISPSMKVTSHLLNEDEYTWMTELFSSPDVYMYDSRVDAFVPVTVRETSYEYRNYHNSKLKPLEFTVQFSDDYNAQFL